MLSECRRWMNLAQYTASAALCFTRGMMLRHNTHLFRMFVHMNASSVIQAAACGTMTCVMPGHVTKCMNFFPSQIQSSTTVRAAALTGLQQANPQ